MKISDIFKKVDGYLDNSHTPPSNGASMLAAALLLAAGVAMNGSKCSSALNPFKKAEILQNSPAAHIGEGQQIAAEPR